MSFRHVVQLRWQPGTSAEQAERLRSALLALAETLEGCESYVCGPSAGAVPTSYDFGLIATFADKAAWEAYMGNAEHDRIREDLINPHVAERATIQISD
jgi:quinol monooxygenase YgiN